MALTISDTAGMNGAQFRASVRKGLWRRPTAGCCSGYTQLNLVVLPERYANDFRMFCEQNPKPCPLLETVARGEVEAVELAPGSDLRIDCPGYKIFRGSHWELQDNAVDVWQNDFVSFLLGCSFTFEQAMIGRNIPVRHVELGCNVPMYITNIPCEAAGPFHGSMVVSMRPVPAYLIEETYAVTGCYPAVHGAPIHHGDPAKIGVTDILVPDFGDPVPIYDDEIPVFWACGVTPQVALANLQPDIAVTHAPGFMFVSDRRDEEFYIG